jgi:hypothetical protein
MKRGGIRLGCMSGGRPQGSRKGQMVHVNPCLPIWRSFVDEVNARRLSVLEVGSRQPTAAESPIRREFTGASEYVGFDFHAGHNVHIVGDVHQLSRIVGRRFEVICSFSTLEHLPMPWVAAVEMIETLAVGGIMFHHVPFNWPLHELPWDFWRFTTETYRALFPPAFGVEIEGVGADDPLHMHLDEPPPHQASFHEEQGYGFFGAKMRKIREVDLSAFRWPLTLTQLLGNSSTYPAP